MNHAGFDPSQIEQFRSALQKSGKRSVDAFLEHRPEFLDVGKVATALFLIPCERDESLFGRQETWYDYFFRKLNARFEEFSHNSFSILTFTYDRSLERYLLTALMHSYGKTIAEAAEQLRSLEIVHLYGQLGALPPLGSDGDGISYGAPIDPDVLKNAAAGIRIIHETVADRSFGRAHDLLRRAERICFLGFGYDLTNIERLMQHGTDGRPEIWGSAMGLTARECRIIEYQFKNFGFGRVQDLDYSRGEALSFLREHCPFD